MAQGYRDFAQFLSEHFNCKMQKIAVNAGLNVSISGAQNYNSGAGAVVIRDIPECCTAVGNPAKPIKFNK